MNMNMNNYFRKICYIYILFKKGILSDVTLDGKVLKNWNICLTDNFIPNYRKQFSSNDPSFIDLVARYTISQNLLQNKNLKLNLKLYRIINQKTIKIAYISQMVFFPRKRDIFDNSCLF